MDETPFCLLQISDCHLSADPRRPYRGGSADAGLRAVLERARTLEPDAVLCTGDLSEDGSTESYQRLLAYLEAMAVPIYALPGNHDDSATMRRYFPAGPWHGPLLVPAGGWCLALLNSAVAGRIDGTLDVAALAGLEAALREQPGSLPVLLALHHQPMPVGARWIDRYPLEAPEPLHDLVRREPRIRCVTWGHVHHAFEQQQDATWWVSAPSTAANSRPATERFTPDPAGPACRWFKLFREGAFETGVLHAA